MSLTADVFPKLWICKDVVTYMSKRPLFRKPFGSQHVKGYQTLLKTPEQRFYPFLITLGEIEFENASLSYS